MKCKMLPSGHKKEAGNISCLFKINTIKLCVTVDTVEIIKCNFQTFNKTFFSFA